VEPVVPPAQPSLEDEFNEFQKRFSEEDMLIIRPLLDAEHRRSGANVHQLFVDICKYSNDAVKVDPHNRAFHAFVVDYIIHANNEVERLTLEEGMQRSGGRIDAQLVSPEELEAQRRALFKPVLHPKVKKDPRKNPKRDKAINKARHGGNSRSNDEEDWSVL
jgi:hypothetical protein